MGEARFGSAVGLVRWHLTTGRSRMGGLKAIDNEPKAGGARDFWRMEATHQLFALTSRCLGSVVETRRAAVLEAAYGAGLSDLRIAERLGVAETTVRRSRSRGLRQVEARAMELNGVAFAQLGRWLLEPQ